MAKKTPRVRFSYFCACGASVTGTTNAANVDRALDLIAEAHKQPGCEPCDAKTAAKARRKHYREMANAVE